MNFGFRVILEKEYESVIINFLFTFPLPSR